MRWLTFSIVAYSLYALQTSSRSIAQLSPMIIERLFCWLSKHHALALSMYAYLYNMKAFRGLLMYPSCRLASMRLISADLSTQSGTFRTGTKSGPSIKALNGAVSVWAIDVLFFLSFSVFAFFGALATSFLDFRFIVVGLAARNLSALIRWNLCCFRCFVFIMVSSIPLVAPDFLLSPQLP